MNCIITVKAGPGNGRPVQDRSGPVSSFLVDNTVFYSAISKHLKKCSICSPSDILGVLLKRRKTLEKFHGYTSSSLVDLALRFEKFKNDPPSKEMVDEVIVRSGIGNIIEHAGRFSMEEIISGFRQTWALWAMNNHKDHINPANKLDPYKSVSERYVVGTQVARLRGRTMWRIIQILSKNPDVDDEELLKLAVVSDIMES